MSANEFAFLALGLILGVAAGIAIIVVLRARPPSPREIRLTVTPDSIPRRATTLAANDLSTPVTSAARGGPAADAGVPIGDPMRPRDGAPGPASGASDRTGVHDSLPPARPASDPGRTGYALAAPTAREPFVLGPPLSSTRSRTALPGGLPASAASGSPIGTAGIALAERGRSSVLPGSTEIGPGPGRGFVGIEVGPGPGDATGQFDGGRSIAVASGRPSAVGGGAPRGAFGDDGSFGQVTEGMAGGGDSGRSGGGAGGPDGGAHAGSNQGATGPSWAAGGDGDDTDACAAQRRVAEERCGAATRLAGLADAAQASLRDAQLTADQHQTRASEAAARADPRGIRVAKEAAQGTFRTSRAAATGRDGIEAAARAWLQDINRINREAREATLTHRREQDAANALLATIERLSVEADAARITAESAQAACLAAREALATCEEAATRARRSEAERRSIAAAASAGSGGAIAEPARTDGQPEPHEEVPPEYPGLGAAALLSGTQVPGLFRLLQGDRDAMRHIVDELSGGDPTERRRWQLQLSDLVDALLARAIESSILDFPTNHPFWGMFTRLESRDIAAALSSLGYRFDGLGGFVDGRIPSQRDLSLAVGYAGLDPMRIRRWPNEAEMPSLLGDVTVSADEYVASVAGNLTLGDLVTVLGRRADGLADLWNAWGRVRPLLLSATETERAPEAQA